MKVLKTAIIVLIVLVILAIIGYFIPFEYITQRLPIIKELYNNTSLSINSRNGKAAITIDGKSYGETPQTITDLPAGTYTVVLTKVSTAVNTYQPKEVKIDLEKNTEAVVDIEVGPLGIVSGYTLFYTKTPIKANSGGYMTIASNTENCKVYIDDEYFMQTPVNVYELPANNFKVKITKDGYEDLQFPVIIRNGYNLNISVYLYPIPTTIAK